MINYKLMERILFQSVNIIVDRSYQYFIEKLKKQISDFLNGKKVHVIFIQKAFISQLHDT